MARKLGKSACLVAVLLWHWMALGGALAAPAPGVAWDWQLSDPIKVPRGIGVFDTDPEYVSKADIRRMRRAGIYTICYVSVGTVENYRADAAAFPARVVGRVYGDWPDERFLDIRALDVLLPIMRARFERCRALGFDAVEPDNLDVYENRSGFRISAGETVRYVKALARLAHGMGLEIGQKNVPELSGRLVGVLDFAIAEGCYQDGWCAELAPYVRARKPIFDAEYTGRPINWKKACARGRQLGISMILKHQDLGRFRRGCEQ